MFNSRTSLCRTSKLGFLPSFSILYRYRSVISTLFANASMVIPAFSRAALMIHPSVSGWLCTYSPPPYIIILIYAIFVMAQQFNYKCTDSSQLTELNIEYQPRQIKKRGFVGAIQHAYTLQIQVFWIGGIFLCAGVHSAFRCL